MDACKHFKGKRITVMGLGLLGRGVGDTAFLSECGAELVVTDLKDENVLAPSLEQLKGYENIQYVLGEHREQDFVETDMVLKSAGVPFDSPYIEAAKAHNIPVVMSAALVAKHSKAKMVGVTGTRGKSTVTQLIYHILQQAGVDAHLGGNVRGIATLPLLREADEQSILVMELDSWQLQGFEDAQVSPEIAVFTSFLPDHMDYYKNDMQRYFADKSNIFAHQKKKDVLITSPQANRAIERYSAVRPDHEVVVEALSTANSSLRGQHNAYNAALAAEACRQLGVSEQDIASGIESFPGVEGRLQFVRTVSGIDIYNDNNATSPDATIAGLCALGENVVLIMGGADKGLSMDALIDVLPQHCRAVVLFMESGTERIAADVEALSGVEVVRAQGLADSLKKALDFAQEGDSILFSPAFASFGTYFNNEYERNDQFLSLVEEL